MSDIPRRRLLGLAGAATTVALAGCSSSTDEPEDNSSDEDLGDDNETDASGTDEDSDTELTGTVLGDIDIENLSDESHTIDVIVEFDGVFEEWKTVTLEERSGTTLDREWPTDAGSFRVIGRLDEGNPIEVTPRKWNDPTCLNLDVLVRQGELTVSGRTDGGSCSAEEN